MPNKKGRFTILWPKCNKKLDFINKTGIIGNVPAGDMGSSAAINHRKNINGLLRKRLGFPPGPDRTAGKRKSGQIH